MSDVDNLIIEDEAAEDMQAAFAITSDEEAEWAIRKIKEAQADTAAWKAFYAEQLRKVDAANAATAERMTMYLREYFRSVPHKASKTQESYALPSGKLAMKVPPVQYERDESKLVAWLEQAGKTDMIKVRKVADWETLKKLTTLSGGQVVEKESGEIVDGVTAVQPDPVFTVSIKEG